MTWLMMEINHSVLLETGAIRLVVDVGIHTEKLTKRDAVAYMMAHESIDQKIAVAEVERYMA